VDNWLDSSEPDSPIEPDDSLHWQIGLVHRALSRLNEQKLQAAAGLSSPQAKVILTLNDESGVKLGRLSERLGCDIGAMSRVVSKMASKGLLERTRDSIDARCWQISLTERGRAQAMQVGAVLNEVDNDALSMLTASERERFVDCLKRMAKWPC